MIWVLLLALSRFILQGDVVTFWIWWLLALVLGMIMLPSAQYLFAGFEDKGWIFSKVFAIAASGLLTWLLVSLRIVSFHRSICVAVVLIIAAINIIILLKTNVGRAIRFTEDHISLILTEEILFFAAFLIWTYLAGFNPAAYGTEKFMDYGFMEAMMRSDVLPAKDLWYSEGVINYYYGGQYFAVFLTKLSGTKVEITYNLMRCFVAAFAFAMPFSLVYQLTFDRVKVLHEKAKNVLGYLSGMLAGLAVAFAGNMHYVIYAKIIPWIQTLKGEEISGYWFPDATRYIGFNPDRPDKTIHEFPCYSFVLGDLHAHVVNIMFVLLLMGILYAYTRNIRLNGKIEFAPKSRSFWKKVLLQPHVICASVLLGMFHLNNYWDFIIYFVVCGGVILFTDTIVFEGKGMAMVAVLAAQAAEVLLISSVIILPFTLQFVTMVQGVAFAQYHSLFYQLMVLWGLPVILSIVFLISLFIEKKWVIRERKLHRLFEEIAIPDLFVVVLSFCAMGLVLIPELVYVRDIYEAGNARANTMFKLTYQAYIMFGMIMAYVIVRILAVSKQKVLKVFAVIGCVFLLWTVGYFGKAVDSWFSGYADPSRYQGLDATAFLEMDFPEDAGAIRWLKENIQGSPVVLEANGDSYTGYERVSAMTGLPTVLGWYVHEWLWRNDTASLNVKATDIETIYTSSDTEMVKALFERYNISYVFVGQMERDKYQDGLKEELLANYGEVVYQSPNSDTFIVKIK
ncbi:MAG: DUF2298 domain-containing protein [Eubacteriales bacterium]|nr:DUF2298 domain-containing protein [Eubacteriales bacterium]